MANFRLVRLAETGLIMNDALYDELVAEGFEIPEVPPFPDITMPVRPTLPQNTTEGIIAWKQYAIELRQWSIAYNAWLSEREAVVRGFAEILSQSFLIATWVVVGQSPTGQRVWDWVLEAFPKYTFSQFSYKILGIYKSLNTPPLEWIAYKHNNQS